MARTLHVGFFQVDDPRRIPAYCHAWMTPDGGVSSTWDASIVQGRPLVMELHPTAEEFQRDDLIREHLERVRRYLIERGLTPTAMGFGEEWYLAPRPDFAAADAIRGRVNAALRAMKQVWPMVYTLQLETFYNDVRAFGVDYYQPAYDCDILGIDAFLWADGTSKFFTDGLPLDAQSPYEKFAREVGMIYEHAHAQYQKPIMMVPHAFHADEGAWRVAPTARQLRWYYELAQRLPNVIALSWFARFSLSSFGHALDQHPALLAEVTRECHEMGYPT